MSRVRVTPASSRPLTGSSSRGGIDVGANLDCTRAMTRSPARVEPPARVASVWSAAPKARKTGS